MYRAKLLDSKSTRSNFLKSLENALDVRSRETQAYGKAGQVGGCHGTGPGSGAQRDRQSDPAGQITDIGKIAIPSSLLEKPGKLTAEEWELMKKHPEIGYRIALSCPRTGQYC